MERFFSKLIYATIPLADIPFFTIICFPKNIFILCSFLCAVSYVFFVGRHELSKIEVSCPKVGDTRWDKMASRGTLINSKQE